MAHRNFLHPRGTDLLSVLLVTKLPVKWLRPGEPVRVISAQMALAIVKAGIYEGKAKPNRVLLIREIDYRIQPQDDSHYWDQRAVVKWHADQRESSPESVRTAARAANWTAMLSRQPAPLSWQV